MTEKELLIDCLIRLNRVDIPYMLTGSMASRADHVAGAPTYAVQMERVRMDL